VLEEEGEVGCTFDGKTLLSEELTLAYEDKKK